MKKLNNPNIAAEGKKYQFPHNNPRLGGSYPSFRTLFKKCLNEDDGVLWFEENKVISRTVKKKDSEGNIVSVKEVGVQLTKKQKYFLILDKMAASATKEDVRLAAIKYLISMEDTPGANKIEINEGAVIKIGDVRLNL